MGCRPRRLTRWRSPRLRRHANGAAEIRIRELATGTEYALFPGDGFQRTHPRWSSDGRALSDSRRLKRPAEGRRGTSLMRWSTARAEEEPLTSPGSPVGVAQSWGPAFRLAVGRMAARSDDPSGACCRGAPPGVTGASRRAERASGRRRRQIRLLRAGFVAGRQLGRLQRRAAKRKERNIVSPLHRSSASGAGDACQRRRDWEDKLRWADDSRFVYFVSDASGFFNIWARRFDGESGTLLGEAFRVTDFRAACPCDAIGRDCLFAQHRRFTTCDRSSNRRAEWKRLESRGSRLEVT